MADLGRLGQRPLASAFILAAIVVAVGHAVPIYGDASGGDLSAFLAFSAVSAGTAVVVSLLPAMLLWRAPSAPRTHRLLFTGLALGTFAELVRVAAVAAPLGADEPTPRTLLVDAAWIIVLVGILFVGLGLLQLRNGRTTRRGLAVVIVVLYLVLALLPLGIEAAAGPVGIGSGFVLASVLIPIAAAFAIWVAVDAWLDREPPTAFWALLAAGLPLHLAGGLLSETLPLPVLVALPANSDFSNELVATVATIGAILGLIAVVLAGIAYGRHVPVVTSGAPEEVG